MKTKYLLLIILTLTFVNSTAQSYIPFQFGDTRWMYNEQNIFNTKSYCYFSKDTTGYNFNGTKYYRIDKLNSPTYSPSINYSYLYDDTANRKVFTLDTLTNTAYLLYDFSTNVGDTIYSIYNLGALDTVIVDSIKSLPINLINRKHFFVHSYKQLVPQSRVWIEGIGSNYDLFYPTLILPDPLFYLVCQEYNTATNFGDALSCSNFLTNTSNIANFKTVEIYPNPSSDRITVHTQSSFQEITIIISDLTGTPLLQKKNITQEYMEIDISFLKSGIYSIELIERNTNKYWRKLLIKN